MGSGAQERKPITTRLRDSMHRHRYSVYRDEMVVGMPADAFDNECDIIDSAYVTLEGLYATSCDACDKLDERCTQLKRERDSALSELERMQSEEPDASEYVKLPLDADGVPIRVGDVMEWSDGTTFQVEGFSDKTLFYVDGGNIEWTSTDCKRHHHHEPTVEDVLEEFYDALGWDEADNHALKRDEIIAECADRLREVMRDGRD